MSSVKGQNLADWLLYLENLHPQTIDLGLTRVQQVAEILKLQSPAAHVITVAGTNGKGTSVALLESILLQAGYRVGSYTSPHLLHYNERIKINGNPVTDAEICAAFKVIEQARGTISLTYFEFSTLAALWLFKHTTLDNIILEVGLGGRLDAVNIIDADIAVITTIALDHMDLLGTDLTAIGREKAGIFRKQRTAVCGDYTPPDSVLSYAAQVEAELFCYGIDFNYQKLNDSMWEWRSKTHCLTQLPLPNIPLQNAGTVLKVIALLPEHFTIARTAIVAGLQQVSLAGRFEYLPGEPACVVDVAHNPAAAYLLAQQLQPLAQTQRIFAVVGMLTDKDHAETFKPLVDIISHWFIGSLTVLRGAEASLLATKLHDLDVSAEQINCYANVNAAYTAATQTIQEHDLMVVFGSFYTVAQIISLRL